MKRFRGPVGVVVIALVAASCAPDGPATPTTVAASTEPLTTTEAPGTDPDAATAAPDLATVGKSLAARNGCAACHISRGAPTIGPEWAGLYGKIENLTDGSTVLVDDAYVTESILDPNAKIVQGYGPGTMPTDFAIRLSDDDVEAIIAYIRSLK